jgi:4-hydroxy-tetrahydrodipicolinate synthase
MPGQSARRDRKRYSRPSRPLAAAQAVPFDQIARDRGIGGAVGMAQRGGPVARADLAQRGGDARIGGGGQGKKQAQGKGYGSHGAHTSRAAAARNTQTWQWPGLPLGSARFRRGATQSDKKERVMFKGSMPALVTPFKDGALDIETLHALVDWQIEEGSTGIVPVGTTGESPTLSHAEHDRVVEEVVSAAAGRVPVIAGTGSNNTAEAIRLIRHAEKVGADAALVVTPYYNKPTQAGLIAHFRAVHDACDLPIIIYNIPGRSVVDMSPETMGELARLPRIVGVKDATGKLERVSMQRESCGKDFIQLSGEDATALGFNAHGGVGCISVTANVAPRLCAEFQAATLAGDYAAALDFQDRLMPLHVAIFLEPGLAGAKYGLSRLGRCSEEVRLPLVGLTEGVKDRIDAAMRHAGLLN